VLYHLDLPVPPSSPGVVAGDVRHARYEGEKTRQPWKGEINLHPMQVGPPLEVLRTAHSFDPSLACAIHTFDLDGTEVTRVS